MQVDYFAVQERLRAKGYSPGPIDGIPGRRTAAAVKAYQKDHGIVVKWPGTLGPTTIAHLFGETIADPADPDMAVEPPWFVLAAQKMGLHETLDNSELKTFLKSDGATLGDPSKLPWCFTGETEILTEDGWQRLDSLTAGRVWQVDETGAASLTGYIPIAKDYDGTAFRIAGSTIQAVCDEGHRWWGSWGRQGREQRQKESAFGTLADLGSDGLRIDPVRTAAAGVGMADLELTMIAAFMSDGKMHRGRVEFEVSRERKIVALTALAPQHVYRQPRAYGPLTVTPLTVFTFDVPACFDRAFASYKVLSREFINELSVEQCRTFLWAYAQFDGHTRDDGRLTLYTSDETTRDDLMTIATLAGYWPRLEPGGRSELTRKPSWRVGIMPVDGGRKRIRQRDVTREQFTGQMFCVTVPDGRIIIRGEGMTPCVTGNCGDFVETCVALALANEPMIVNPYLARNWMKFGVGLAEPAVGAIMPFWRGDPNGISGHVGFYVGEDANNYIIRGGNQSNRISDAPLDKGRSLGFRWPSTWPLPKGGRVLGSTAGMTVSTNEA